MKRGIPPVANGPSPTRSRERGGDECFSRVPYASVMATVMCAIGVILFATMTAWAVNASVEQTRRSLDVDNLPWLAKVRIFFVVIAVLMSLSALALLTIGAMSTGSTRDELYRGMKGRMGGRMANALAMITAYIFNICWLVCFGCTSVLCFIYFVFDSLCASFSTFSESSCLDFSLFRPLFQRFSSSSLVLCGGEVQQFCALSSTAFAWYVVGLVGCAVVVKALVHFLICAAANYAHVTSGTKYADLRELLISEDVDALNLSEFRGGERRDASRMEASQRRTNADTPFRPY